MSSLLPDIVKEAKIVSGKENNNSASNGNLAAATATSISYDFLTRESLDLANDSSKIKSQVKISTNNNNNNNMKKKHSFSAKDVNFPHLILNDTNRSSSYQRAQRPSDITNVQNSPLATRLIYNWKPLERLPTKVVQAKVKIYKPPKRIDQPARPPSPYRIKSDWETIDTHFHNQKRTQEMKSLQYLKQHTNWSIYPYASIDEREGYNKNIRETLKEQMEQKEASYKREQEKKILEYKFVALQDANCLNEDRQKRLDKLKFLSSFRDDNKQLMEDRWMHKYLLKKHEWQYESQLLGQDPINWSKTLK